VWAAAALDWVVLELVLLLLELPQPAVARAPLSKVAMQR
jgi:hypothetical protein